jgi:hypothetical protein
MLQNHCSLCKYKDGNVTAIATQSSGMTLIFLAAGGTVSASATRG